VGSFAEIPNAGHTCHSDNPAAFLSAMESFLAAAGIA
jgi:pimeloyl-ACP methyl ester carboxylesterase